MVQAEKKDILNIINAIKKLPVDCTKFETADTWVGIIMALETILENEVGEDLSQTNT